MIQTIVIPHGNRTITFRIPAGVTVAEPEIEEIRPCSAPLTEINDALDCPVGGSRLEEILNPGQRVCIISDDNTRPTPVKLILAALLPRLERAGIEKENICIVMALGSHRYMTEQEMIRKVGHEVYLNYKVVNSEFKDTNKLVCVGKSERGTDIQVCNDVIDSDIRIGLGNIIPHGTMGWSGGAKILYPGVTSEEIVSEFHVLQGLQDEILFGMEDCPVRLAVEKWTEKIGLHFIINTVMTPDLKLFKVVAGHFVTAHRKGVSLAKLTCGGRVYEAPDVVVTSSHPISIDYWQCGKGLYGACKIVKAGGTVILVAPCYEGIGPHENVTYFTGVENGEWLLKESLENPKSDVDLLAMAVGVSLGKLRKKCRIIIVSDGISEKQMRESGYDWYPESGISEAVEKACSCYEVPKLLVIRNGGEIVPYLST